MPLRTIFWSIAVLIVAIGLVLFFLHRRAAYRTAAWSFRERVLADAERRGMLTQEAVPEPSTPHPLPELTVPTREELLALSDEKLDEQIYLPYGFDIFSYLEPDEFAPDSSLPPILRNAVMTRNFEWSISLDGLETYLNNTRGRGFSIAYDGYRYLGMQKETEFTLFLMDKLKKELEKGEIRRDVPELNEQFFALFDQETQEKARTAFLREHIDEVIAAISDMKRRLDALRVQ